MPKKLINRPASTPSLINIRPLSKHIARRIRRKQAMRLGKNQLFPATKESGGAADGTGSARGAGFGGVSEAWIRGDSEGFGRTVRSSQSLRPHIQQNPSPGPRSDWQPGQWSNCLSALSLLMIFKII
jgi:hypothetical protein